MEERNRFVALAESGAETVSELCRRFGISRKTGYKWLARKRELGIDGLRDRSRRPRSSSRAVAEDVVKLIVQLKRRHPSWGPKKIRRLLEADHGVVDPPHVNTVGSILRRRGLVSRRRRRPRVDRPAWEGLTDAKRPNHVWAVDFKGWFTLGDGQRCDPLTVSDLFSRYVLLCKAMPNQQLGPAMKAFEQLFRSRGLPEIIRVDNGSPFASVGPLGLSRLSAWWISLGIVVEFTRPGKPQDNGSHERMHKTLKADVASPPSANARAQRRRFERWRREFNHVRPHERIGMLRPAELYQPSARRLGDCDNAVRYPEGWETKTASSSGSISHRGNSDLAGEAFAGMPIGLKRKGRSTYEAYFANLRLGRLVRNKAGKAPWRPPAYILP